MNNKSPTSFNYSPPPLASPLTLFDGHEMADLIRRTTPTDTAIIAHIAAQIETTSMSGQDFLRLSRTDVRMLSQGNTQVYRELRRIQRIAPDAIPSFTTPFFHNSGLSALFPELSPLIYNHQLPDIFGGVQITENFDCDFDFSDDEDELVNETSSLPPPSPHLAAAISVSQEQLDNSLQLDTSVNPAENEPPLTSPTPTGHGAAVADDAEPQPIHDESTRSSSPALSYVDDEDPDAATLLSPGDIHMASDPPSQLTPDSLEVSHLEHSLRLSPDRPQTSIDTQGTSDPAVTLIASLSSLGCSLLNLLPFPESSDLELHNPIDDTRLDVNEDINVQASGLQQNSNTESVDRDVHEVDQPMCSNGDPCDFSTSDDTPSSKHILEPAALTLPHSAHANIQNVSTSTDEAFEDPVSDVESPLCPSTPASLEDDHDLDESDLEWLQDTNPLEEQSNVGTDIPTISISGAIIPIDIIPVTPSDSPIFDGLDRYMTPLLHSESQAPGVPNSAVHDDTPVPNEQFSGERTLWPPSDAPRRGLLSSRNRKCYSHSASNSLESTPESDTADVAIQPDPSHVQVQARDPFLGTVSDNVQRIMRAIPSVFALNRSRTTSCSATGPSL